MFIQTLVENTTRAKNLKNKHGLSFYIETLNHKLLFDLGPDKTFIENARTLGVNIEDVDLVIISHGHLDHGGGLKAFLNYNHHAKIYIREQAFEPHYTKVAGIHFPCGLDQGLKNHPQVILTTAQTFIDDELMLFSDIQTKECYSTSNNALFTKKDNKMKFDDFTHEQSLILKENDNYTLLSGCAHAGILNIQRRAQEIIHKEINAVVSGFHLFNPVFRRYESKSLITQIAGRLNQYETNYYTCHCTGKKAFDILKEILGHKIQYISTGSIVEL